MALITIVALSLVPIVKDTAISIRNTNSSADNPFSSKEYIYDLTAGFADEIHFEIIEGEMSEHIQALIDDNIDLIGNFVYENVSLLESDPVIDINTTNRSGFGQLSFNCQQTPLNWSVLRTAFARALDKNSLQAEIFDGYSRSLDSPISFALPTWSLDNDPGFMYNYYSSDILKANQTLDDAGFVDINDDGWREDPNGFPIHIPIMRSDIVSSILDSTVNASIDAFHSIGINASADIMSFFDLLDKIDTDDYYAGFWGYAYQNLDPSFLESFTSTSSFGNFQNWYNSSYDNEVSTMMESTDLSTVKQACKNAQKIFWEEQPLVVLYQNMMVSAHRNDRWTGFINVEGGGEFDTWSLLKAHLKPGIGTGDDYDNWMQGGQLRVSLPNSLSSTNPLINSYYTDLLVLNLVYDRLISYNPYTLEDCPWLAKDWLIEEVDPVSPSVPRGQVGDMQKMTYFLHDDLYWHDGSPLTASDVAFSYQLMNDSASAYHSALTSLTHVEVVNSTTVEVFTNKRGLFVPQEMSIPILPESIWGSITDPFSWDNPNPVGSGPYAWFDHSPGSYLELQRNDNFVYNPRNYAWLESIGITSTTTTTTTLTSTSTTTSIYYNHPPEVSINYPNGGETVSGIIDITWNGYDSDGDAIFYTVYYSPDFGNTWVEIISNILMNHYSWDTRTVPDGSYIIKVKATDNYLTTEDNSDGIFTVANDISSSSETTTSEEETTTSEEETTTTLPFTFSTRGYDAVMTMMALILPSVLIYWKRKKR